jgi:hypothetical protein
LTACHLGLNGMLAGFEDTAIQFLDVSSGLLGRVSVDQTSPGYSVVAGPYTGADSVLLPAEAFDDNLLFAPVPEPEVLPVIVGLGALVYAFLRRRAPAK